MTDDIYECIKDGYIGLFESGKEIRVSALCESIDITMSEFYQCYHDIVDLGNQLQRDEVREMSKRIESSMPDGFDVNIYVDEGLEFMNEHSQRFTFFIETLKDSGFMDLWSKSLVKSMKKRYGSEDVLSLEMVSFAIIRGMIEAFQNDAEGDHEHLKSLASKMIGIL